MIPRVHFTGKFWTVPVALIALIAFLGCRDTSGQATVRVLIDHSDSTHLTPIDLVKERILEDARALDRRSEHMIILGRVRDTENPDDADSTAIPLRVPSRHCPLLKRPCRELNRKWRRFEARLGHHIATLFKGGVQPRSYILRATALRWPKATCDTNCRLWIVSDMLENSGSGEESYRINFYDIPVPSFDSLRTVIMDKWGFPENLGGSKVIIHRLKRCPSSGGLQQDHETFKIFWDNYFRDVTRGIFPEWSNIPIGGDCPKEP